MKKTLLTILMSLPCLTFAQTTTKPLPAIHVTLLGTGVPLLNAAGYVAQGRATAGLLIEAGTERMLFDCGQNVVTRLDQSGNAYLNANIENPPNVAVDRAFISHLHSDHMADLASLYGLGWLYRNDDPLMVWGPGPGPDSPFGMSSIISMLRLVWDADYNVRAVIWNLQQNPDIAFSPVGMEPIVNDLAQGVVYQKNGVKVTAFLVDHDPVTPAYGFRVDYAGHAVVFSGDTTYNQNLVTYATGADVIIHEIWGWTEADGTPELWSYHTNPQDWARVMLGAGPKMAVMTHISLQPPGYPDLPNGSNTTTLVAAVKAAGWTGGLTVGQDLMTIDIADSGVTVTPPASPVALDDPTAISVEVAQSRRAHGLPVFPGAAKK
jgi:ribonuclease Z